MNKVYVILLNWNGEIDTCNCIESLLSISYKHLEIVICDNHSEQQSVDYIKTFCQRLSSEGRINSFYALQNSPFTKLDKLESVDLPKVTLIQTGGNLGFAGGVNVGLKYAISQNDAEYYWILNNDCIATRDSLNELLHKMKFDPKIGICGSTLIYEHDRETVQALGGASYNKYFAASRSIGAFERFDRVIITDEQVEARMSYVVGASMLVSNALIKEIGLMDESYFLYSEEHDWAYRALLSGFKLGYASKSIIFHKHGASIGSDAKGGSPKSMFYLYRSKILFTKKFHCLLTPLVYVYCLYVALKFALKGNPVISKSILKAVCNRGELA